MSDDCLICKRIKMIGNGSNPYFVRELDTGYVVIGDYQTYRGYSLFLSKEHAEELHELDDDFRKRFLEEMSVVAEAVYRAFNPDKMNYELLGNTDRHVHWHLFPRRKNDDKAHTAVWAVRREKRMRKPTTKELNELKKRLGNELSKLID